MKILFFAHDFAGGGAEMSLLTIASGLVNRGHEVTIAANLRNPAYPLPSYITYIEKDKGQKRADSFKYIFKKLRNRYFSIITTRRIIKNVAPDVIVTFLHANMQEIVFTHGKIPIVSSERNAFDRKLSKREKNYKYFWNKYFDKVTVLTRYDKAFIGRKLNNVVVMPNPLSSEPITLDDYEENFSSRCHLLACGRLSGLTTEGELVKGFDLLIEAFAKIANKYPEWHLDIAGNGKDSTKKNLIQLADKNGIAKRVNFIGFVSDTDSLMKSHSIFVLSSREEGFGRVVIEAMAMGCPVVSFNCSGPSEIITDGVDGYLVERGNVEQLASKIEELIRDSRLRYDFGRHALINVMRFDKQKMINKWEDLLLSLIK